MSWATVTFYHRSPAQPNASGQPRGPQARFGCTGKLDSSLVTTACIVMSAQLAHSLTTQPSRPRADANRGKLVVQNTTKVGSDFLEC